jgi:hypothetical protein
MNKNLSNTPQFNKRHCTVHCYILRTHKESLSGFSHKTLKTNHWSVIQEHKTWCGLNIVFELSDDYSSRFETCSNAWCQFLKWVRMDLREVGERRGDWMESAQGRDSWRALVNAVKNFRVPKRRGISWLAAKPVSFSRGTLLHGVSKYVSKLCLTVLYSFLFHLKEKTLLLDSVDENLFF